MLKFHLLMSHYRRKVWGGKYNKNPNIWSKALESMIQGWDEAERQMMKLLDWTKVVVWPPCKLWNWLHLANSFSNIITIFSSKDCEREPEAKAELVLLAKFSIKFKTKFLNMIWSAIIMTCDTTSILTPVSTRGISIIVSSRLPPFVLPLSLWVWETRAELSCIGVGSREGSRDTQSTWTKVYMREAIVSLPSIWDLKASYIGPKLPRNLSTTSCSLWSYISWTLEEIRRRASNSPYIFLKSIKYWVIEFLR